MEKNEIDFNYCPYCNGKGKVKREDGKILTCIACKGTGERGKDYGNFYKGDIK
jgi:ribosomal protein L37AE/L43A